MTAVLGIDAAWTTSQPSGVALVVDDGAGWSLRLAASSYLEFLDETSTTAPPRSRPVGSIADVSAMLDVSWRRALCPVDLVAVDIPLSMAPITGRRIADDLVSRAYGARHSGTHTPSVARPGKISDDMRATFASLGYPLATGDIRSPCLIEVYPHPALIELTGAAKRLPYKESKIRKYWPNLPALQRRQNLVDVWRIIVAKLDEKIAGTSAFLAVPAIGARQFELKAFEDALDAVICCWVGICALEGLALPFGDETAAIWIPKPAEYLYGVTPQCDR